MKKRPGRGIWEVLGSWQLSISWSLRKWHRCLFCKYSLNCRYVFHVLFCACDISAIKKQKNIVICIGYVSGGRRMIREPSRSEVRGKQQRRNRKDQVPGPGSQELRLRLSGYETFAGSPQGVRPGLWACIGLLSLPPLFVLTEGPCLLIIVSCCCTSELMGTYDHTLAKWSKSRRWAELGNRHKLSPRTDVPKAKWENCPPPPPRLTQKDFCASWGSQDVKENRLSRGMGQVKAGMREQLGSKGWQESQAMHPFLLLYPKRCDQLWGLS